MAHCGLIVDTNGIKTQSKASRAQFMLGGNVFQEYTDNSAILQASPSTIKV